MYVLFILYYFQYNFNKKSSTIKTHINFSLRKIKIVVAIFCFCNNDNNTKYLPNDNFF